MDHPGGHQVVALYSVTIAGPGISWPGSKSGARPQAGLPLPTPEDDGRDPCIHVHARLVAGRVRGGRGHGLYPRLGADTRRHDLRRRAPPISVPLLVGIVESRRPALCGNPELEALTLVPRVHPPLDDDSVDPHTIPLEVFASACLHRIQGLHEPLFPSGVGIGEKDGPRALPHDWCHEHAERRKEPRVRWDERAREPEPLGELGCMETGRAPERHQVEVGGIDASLDRDDPERTPPWPYRLLRGSLLRAASV